MKLRECCKQFIQRLKNKNMERRFDSYVKKCLTDDEYIRECYGGLPNESMLLEQWKRMPLCKIGYDSEAETLKHIKRVSELLSLAATELLKRGQVHDASKLESPEKELFDEFTPKLKNYTYGSDQYKDFLQLLKPALDHHYANNSHHPEHYENGVNGFDLFDLVEMFFDWKAASERHADGSIEKSIEINKGRFNLSDQLADIFKNTADRYGKNKEGPQYATP